MTKNLLAILLLIAFVINTNAQKTMEKGTIVMEITDVKSDDEQAAMMASMIKGSQMNLHFNGKKSVTQMSMMGGMVNQSTFTDIDANTFDMLFDMMGQKIWVNDKLDAMKNNENAAKAKQSKVTYDKNDKKTILGYDCYAMSIIMPGSDKPMAKAYVTEAIKSKANMIQGMEALEFAGFPLEFTVDATVMQLTMTTKEIKDTVDDTKLKVNGEGYTKMTMEEFTKKMGGMGAGLGF